MNTNREIVNSHSANVNFGAICLLRFYTFTHQTDAASQRDDFSLFNATLLELRSVVTRISTGLDVETARAVTIESQVSNLRTLMEEIEAERGFRAASDNVRVERVEQRLYDLVG